MNKNPSTSLRSAQDVHKLEGANMGIGLASPRGSIAWEQDGCLWNKAEGTDQHKCAVKNVSICPNFCGVEYLDTLLCSYPDENPLRSES